MMELQHKRVTVLALVLTAALLVLVSGCGNKPDTETAPPPPEDTGTTEIPTTPVVEQPVVPDDGNAIDRKNMEPSEYGVKDVFFAFDQYDLDDAAMAVLAQDARVLKDAGTLVLISGHCDERGTVEYNLALGEKRARAVRDYLASLGVPESRMLITSYGENKPFAVGHNEQAWAQNRRAHFERP